MITIILITILFLAELFFSAWNLKTKKQHSKEKMFFRIAFSLLLLLGLLTGILKGTSRYGMLLLLCILQTAHSFLGGYIRKERPVKVIGQIFRPLGNLLLYCFALTPAILFPQYTEPQVTGSYTVTTSQYSWTDESRIETYSDTGENRSVTVKFWYPTEAGSYPLVVFSHGSTGVIDSNTSTFTELASNGYVVASIGHPYQAMMVEDVNGNITPIDMEFLNQVMGDNGKNTPEHIITFLVITALITILEGILGCLFLPEVRFGFEAYFSPPLFGLLSTLTGLVLKSKKELTIRQVLFREFLQLLLIEAIVFGTNYVCGNRFDISLNISLALSIAVVFVLVHVILWLNDRRVARMFNEQLKIFQAAHGE